MKSRILAFVFFASISSFGFSQESETLIGFTGKVPNPYTTFFKEAYTKNPSVPRGLLEAISFNITRFEHRIPESAASCTGIPNYYGVMGLVKDGKGTLRNNMLTIAHLSRIRQTKIISWPQKNILAYAKAFAKTQRRTGLRNASVENLIPVILSLSELPSGENTISYAQNTFLYSLFTFLNDSSNADYYNFPVYHIDLKQSFGENNLHILSSPFLYMQGGIIQSRDGHQYQAFQQGSGGGSSFSANYGPAIWTPTSCYSSRSGIAVSAVAVHDMEGYYSGTISWFMNCNNNVSAHYCLRSSDGQITQMVDEADKAWHIGSENSYTIGLEHEGFSNNASWYTSAMYSSSAALVRDICNSGYGINPLRAHYGPSCTGSSAQCQLGGCIKIKGHQHFPNQTHNDPGPNWNWLGYYRLINNNPSTNTYTAASGNFFDSGGASVDYGDDERAVYVFSPPGATTVTLNFTSFNLELNWDYLYIYDGNSINATLIGTYTGTNSPGTFTSIGSSLTVEFRSDCSTIASGWAATYIGNSPCSPPSNISFSGTLSACNGNTTLITVSASNCSGCSYQWSGGLGSGNTKNLSPGIYIVTATNNCGSSVSGAVRVSSLPLPVTPIITAPSSICQGQSDVIAVTNSDSCNNCAYNWSNSTSGTSTTITTGGVYSVTATNTCGTASTSTLSIQTNPLPVTPVINGNISFCQGDSTVLTVANPCNGCNYLWSDNSTQQSISVHTAGSYSVTVTGTCGTASASQTIIIHSLPTIIISPPAPSVQQGNSITLTASGANSYVWSTGATSTTITISPDSTVTYSVTGTDANACSAISQITITVIPLPPCDTSIHPIVTVNYCDLSVPYYNGAAYQWLLNGDTIANAHSRFYAVVATGYHTCKLTFNSCPDIFSDDRYVSPNLCITNVEEVNTEYLSITPNPSAGRFTLTFETDRAEQIQISVFDVIGRLIKEETIMKNAGIVTKEINLTTTAKGICILQLKAGSKILNRRIEIQ